jgi:CDP-glycerol glycerophosphotransferase (TagB/SpsB family)
MSLPRVDVVRKPEMNRIDMLLSENRELFGRAPLILYAPAPRGYGSQDDDASSSLAKLRALLESVEEHAATLMVISDQLETALQTSADYDELQYSKHLVLNPDIDYLDLLAIVDHVITDYSSIAFEAVISGKPLCFYIPNHEYYKSEYGLNIDPELYMPSSCYREPHAMIESIIAKPLPSIEQEQFKLKFVAPSVKTEVTSAKQIARLILEGIQ